MISALGAICRKVPPPRTLDKTAGCVCIWTPEQDLGGCVSWGGSGRFGCISVFSTYMMAHAHLHAKVPCLLGQGPATTAFCALAQLLILQLRTRVAKDVGALLRLTI